tara:strand:+ start:3238 stop:3471 length:234 start_codon:yes stop_codon:yes gene_type:complete
MRDDASSFADNLNGRPCILAGEEHETVCTVLPLYRDSGENAMLVVPLLEEIHQASMRGAKHPPVVCPNFKLPVYGRW